MSGIGAPACKDKCTYGTCVPDWSDPYGCGGCCRCRGGCEEQYFALLYEDEQQLDRWKNEAPG